MRNRAWVARSSRVVAVSAAVAMAGVVAPLAAHAEGPLSDLDGNITDKVGAIDEREGEVNAAIEQVFEDHSLDLYVAYVDNFSGMNASEWADRTAQNTGLGANDVLLAVATGSRQYATSVDTNYPLSDAQLREIQINAIEPALKENDWAGAAIGAAGGFAAARSGEPIPRPSIQPGEASPSRGGGSATPWIVGGIAVAGVGAAGWAVARSYRKRGGTSIPVDQLSIDDLEKRSGVLLVETDDAIKTNEQEVGFAEAQYGADATRQFAEAVQEAKAHLNESFKLRQKLDDGSIKDEGTKRKMLTEIVERLDSANERLEDEAEAFDKLRDLENNAPEVLAGVQQRAGELGARLNETRATLQSLSAKYVESALETIAGNAEEAASRIEFATTALSESQTKLQANDTSSAALQIQAAELAAGQAGELMDAVDNHAEKLAKAVAGVQEAFGSVNEDLNEARALAANPGKAGSPAASLPNQIAEAEVVLATVQQGLASGKFDPLAALRNLQESGNALSQTLSGVRDAQARAQRARAALDQAVLSARSEIAAGTDFIKTRRGAVGGSARTKLVEAQRYLDQGLATAQADPATALSYAQQADHLAQQANQLARQDVGGFAPQTAGLGGMFGGQSGGNMAGVLMGGILGSMLGGGGGGGRSYGGAPSWGGAGRSRGGGTSRSRRGGSGRF